MTPADILLERPVGLWPVKLILAIGVTAEAWGVAKHKTVITDAEFLLPVEVSAPDVSRPE
jgi:hypothetical protein